MSDNEDVLIVEAVNVRPRPVTIVGFYGKLLRPEDGKTGFAFTGSDDALARFGASLPCQIKDGESAKLMVRLRELENPRNVEYFFASDTTGRDWRTDKRPLIQQLKKGRKRG